MTDSSFAPTPFWYQKVCFIILILSVVEKKTIYNSQSFAYLKLGSLHLVFKEK